MSPDVEKVIEFTLVKFTEVTPTTRSKCDLPHVNVWWHWYGTRLSHLVWRKGACVCFHHFLRNKHHFHFFALAVSNTKTSHFADLKCSKLSSLRMWRGRWFHKLWAADEKARSPSVVFSFKLEYFKMTFDWTETVARLFFYSDQVTQTPRCMTIDTCSFKCKKKYFKILLLRNLAGSQCNEHGTGVMWL